MKLYGGLQGCEDDAGESGAGGCQEDGERCHLYGAGSYGDGDSQHGCGEALAVALGDGEGIAVGLGYGEGFHAAQQGVVGGAAYESCGGAE